MKKWFQNYAEILRQLKSLESRSAAYRDYISEIAESVINTRAELQNLEEYSLNEQLLKKLSFYFHPDRLLWLEEAAISDDKKKEYYCLFDRAFQTLMHLRDKINEARRKRIVETSSIDFEVGSLREFLFDVEKNKVELETFSFEKALELEEALLHAIKHSCGGLRSCTLSALITLYGRTVQHILICGVEENFDTLMDNLSHLEEHLEYLRPEIKKSGMEQKFADALVMRLLYPKSDLNLRATIEALAEEQQAQTTQNTFLEDVGKNVLATGALSLLFLAAQGVAGAAALASGPPGWLALVSTAATTIGIGATVGAVAGAGRHALKARHSKSRKKETIRSNKRRLSKILYDLSYVLPVFEDEMLCIKKNELSSIQTIKNAHAIRNIANKLLNEYNENTDFYVQNSVFIDALRGTVAIPLPSDSLSQRERIQLQKMGFSIDELTEESIRFTRETLKLFSPAELDALLHDRLTWVDASDGAATTSNPSPSFFSSDENICRQSDQPSCSGAPVIPPNN